MMCKYKTLLVLALLHLMTLMGFCQIFHSLQGCDGPDGACIFLTYNELKDKSPSLLISKNKGESISYYFPWGLENIKVVKKDTEIQSGLKQFFLKKKNGTLIYKFKLGKIYGYSKNGEFFRHYAEPKNWKISDGYYRIEEQGEIIIYSKRTMNGKFSSRHYYYSSTFTSQIKSLNLKNIELDLKDKPSVLDRIKSNEKLVKNILEKDTDGTYLLNKVLLQ